MADNFNTATTADTTEEWLTPPHIIQALGEFYLDPCGVEYTRCIYPCAGVTFAGEHKGCIDGLKAPWHGRVWLNPPYGRETFQWMAKLSNHTGGGRRSYLRPHRDEGLPCRSMGQGQQRFLLQRQAIFPARRRLGGRRMQRAFVPCLIYGGRYAVDRRRCSTWKNKW